MIIDALWGIFRGIVETVLSWLPDIEPPDLVGMVTNIGGLFTENVGWLNRYVPIDQLVLVLGVTVGSWVVLYLIRFTVWVLTKAHLLGGE